MMQFIRMLKIHQLVPLLIYLDLLSWAAGSPSVQLHVHKQRISESKDRHYVSQIIRLAKAADMQNYMENEVRACDNFYKYACGRWSRIHPAHSLKKGKTSTYEMLQLAYNQKLLRLLKMTESDENGNAGKRDSMQQVRDFFKSCSHIKVKDKQKLQNQLKDLLIDIELYWPALISPDEMNANTTEIIEQTNWLETIANIRNVYGLNIIFRVQFENNTTSNGSMEHILIQPIPIRNPNSPLERWNYKNGIMRNLKYYLGLDNQQAEQITQDIIDFEIQLLGISNVNSSNSKTTNEKPEGFHQTVEDINSIYLPLYDLKQFIATAFDSQIDSNLEVYNARYLSDLYDLINQTSVTQFANYIMYQMAKVFITDPSLTLIDREKFCLEKTNYYFRNVMNQRIYNSIDKTNISNEIEIIWDHIKGSFKQQLESNNMEWLPPLTRKLSIEKLDTVHLSLNATTIAQTKLSNFYNNLDIDKSDYITNLANLLINYNKADTEIKKALHYEVYASADLSNLQLFVTERNSIVLPIQILQGNHLWSEFYPYSLKFSTLGFLLAREVIHIFLDLIQQTDNMNGKDFLWLDENALKRYQQNELCFKAQYSRYLYNGKYLKERDSQENNILDNTGIHLAFEAYMSWLRKMEATDAVPSDNLPNLLIDNKQLFFLSFAQLFCNDDDNNEMELQNAEQLAPSTPEELRVIGSLANFVKFSENFHCTPGTTMNPQQKSIPILYILAIVPGLMPWKHGYRFLSFCHVFGSVAPWCGSFIYHLFMNIEKGEAVYYTLLKLDMVGIWVTQSFGALPLVTATTFCFTYKWKWFTITTYCLMSLWGLYKALTAVSPWQRRLCFALPFSMRSFLTILRTVGQVGGNRVALPHVYLQDVVSLLGGAIGAMRIPEKWFPGLVDFYLNSHNIMHVLVVVAVYSMHKATIKDFEWMSTTTCGAYTSNNGSSTFADDIIADTLKRHTEL